MSIMDWVGVVLCVSIMLLLYTFVGAILLTEQGLELRLDRSKKEAIKYIASTVFWPIIVIGAILYGIFILLPKSIYKWWRDLPEE